MQNSNLTKTVYRDGVKTTGDKIRMTLYMRHIRMTVTQGGHKVGEKIQSFPGFSSAINLLFTCV